MLNYLKALAAVSLVFGGLNVFSTRQMIEAQGVSMPGVRDDAAWSQYGEPFAKGANDYIGGKARHVRCMDEVNAPHMSQSSATVYLACYTRDMLKDPSDLCVANAKSNLLWHLKHFSNDFGREKAHFEFTHGKGKWKTFNGNAAERPETINIASGEPEAPQVDPMIVEALATFVRAGLVSPEKDLKPYFDISLISDRLTDAEAAAARKETCQ